jgi:ethanolamine ammonia-lyase large subunit
MVYRHAIDATTYVFNDLRDLLAKATPPRSGDRLAGIAADSAAQNDRGADRAGRCASETIPA